MHRYLFIILLTFTVLSTSAQSSYYTFIQGDANIGLANKGYKGTFSGYSASLVVGKNFDDRAFIGIGIGSERLKGSYTKANNSSFDAAIERANYIQDLLPIFIDGRIPIAALSTVSKIGILANAGYAPSVGARYDKGFLFRSGLFYLHESDNKFDWTVSAAYGYQQLTRNRLDIGTHFQQQQINITLGILLK